MRFLSDYSESGEIKDIVIDNTSKKSDVISAVALSENKVFIAYGTLADNFYDNYRKLYGIVCTISNNTITVGTATQLDSGGIAGAKISAVALNENKVFIANYGSSKLFGMVCTISGTSITKGTNTQLSSDSYSSQVISAVKLDEGKVFIAHSYGSNYYLYGMVCTISGTSISKGTDTVISSTSNTGKIISATALSSSSKVFLAYVDMNDGLYAKICTISGTTITYGLNVKLNLISGTEKVISAVALSENKVQVIHGDSNNHLYSMLCDIDNVTITKENDVQLSAVENSGSSISAIALSENNIFIGHSSGSNNYLHGMVLGYLANLVKSIASSTEKIGGVAITSGQAEEMIQVKVPDVI